MYDLIDEILKDGDISEDLLGRIVRRLGKRWERRRITIMSNNGMVCGNCRYYQRDKHCALYPLGSSTESYSVATQQQYCNWRASENRQGKLPAV